MSTTYVSGGGAALANAIGGASTGDVLIVADGVYSPWHNNGKNITVISEHGPAKCIIDGGCVWQDGIVGGTIITQGARCISCYGGIHTIFRGFTIQNGGIFENDGQSNNAQGGGAYGGEFQRCIFKNNYCWKEGGGCTNSNTFRCEFVGNIALVAGAAMRSGNHKFDYIHNNGRIGTGTYCGACYVGNYFGCLIIDNISSGQGAGMMLGNSVNCTIAGNHSTVKNGYGVMLNNGTYSSMHNCIVYGNTTTKTDSDKSEFKADSSIAFSVTDNCLPENSVFGSNVENARNILADPLFVNPPEDDYHLLYLSPCLNAGLGSYLLEQKDIDGNNWSKTPSMGCYQYKNVKSKQIPTKIYPIGGITPDSSQKMTPIEYLETNGNCWIDTGIIPLLTDTVEFKQYVGSTGNNKFGCCGAQWRTNAYALYSWQFWLGGSATGSTVNPRGEAVWRIENKGVYKDGTLIHSFPDATGDPFRSIYLFAIHDYNTTPHNKMVSGDRINYFRLIRDGITLMDMEPVRINSIGYFFDKISGKLFGNAGEGRFILGKDK